MKHKRFLFSWILILSMIPLLAILAWNQFNWLQELNNREKYRIQESMYDSARNLSKRVRNEIMIFPSLVHTKINENITLTNILFERYQFWKYYAINPQMIKNIYIIENEGQVVHEWNDDSLDIVTDSQILKEINRSHTTQEFLESFPDSCNTEIRIYIPLDYKQSNISVLYVIDRSIVLQDVIPTLAQENLESVDLYDYRIINNQDNSLIYTTMTNYREDYF
ncbi:hypothetical protein K7I13_12815 [Brucepastera parasyntrophica]|uniref:hypothetical protein n=1 Tax=Brucepastera parasyntrophica TaxID=2880008 RepID=UPI00210B6C66|nr:hypothetical protein [Brucepastera parasyntrophica]ULQ59352.1 hypothetical protein K7I13_12815 [Brucepastera parasyntrophica]